MQEAIYTLDRTHTGSIWIVAPKVAGSSRVGNEFSLTWA
jgi:hypothetical protein